jgi:hypothetical protein
MAQQSLLWTALPHGWTVDGTAIRVSVMVNPRLNPSGDPAELASFDPDWTDWPATLAAATIHVHFGSDTVTIPVTQTVGPTRVDDTLGLPDSQVWAALFQRELPVRAGDYVDNTSKDILSYDTAAIQDLVSALYGSWPRSPTASCQPSPTC